METTPTVTDNENPNSIPGLTEEENRKAAEIIQRTYRGHRARRQLNGHGLDAETRWYETVRDTQYQHLTTPHAPADPTSNSTPDKLRPVRTKWYHAGGIAKRAGKEDVSVSESSTDEGTADGSKERKAAAAAERKKTAKMMDLQYFLEMVDQKHRYGSNLRKYHAHWKTTDTNQSFFYWLDQGDGSTLDLPECSRARLEKMQVRYLSREERMKYMVKIDQQGLLVWAKDGRRVWTKDELYKDSMNGIVPASDPTPAFKYNIKPTNLTTASEDDFDVHGVEDEDEDDVIQGDENEENRVKANVDNDEGVDEAAQYANEEFHRAKGPEKLKHVSPTVLFNHMVHRSMKKGRKWIFVADPNFRMYIGYKQSGAFQHSSFLHGARILAAGVIKVKDGQLRNLAPLSGHYRPPVRNFRAFVHSLKEAGCDMSRVSISKSYAVLMGLEGYTKTTSHLKGVEKSIVHGFDRMLRPEKAKREEEDQKDKSQSAEKERQFLAKQRQGERENRQHHLVYRTSDRFSQALHGLSDKKKGDGIAEGRGIAGTGPEDGIPPPEGQREKI